MEDNHDWGSNQAGHVVFYCHLTHTQGGNNTDDAGLFFYFPQTGLITIASEGDSLLGSTIAGFLNSDDPHFGFSGSFDGILNNQGQVACYFKLTNGRKGIALWLPPTTRYGLAIEQPPQFR